MKLEHWGILFVLIFSVEILINYFRDYDDTDDEANRERSGLELYTDNKTGCQYLRASYFAELTKRVDGNNNHVGCR